ncbi:MAG: DUF86 domain-containing protein [Cyanobacteria bacterium P01_A01_bin.123]
MSANRDDAALLDIFLAAGKVLKYIQGCDQVEFLSDDKTQSAVVFQLLIIGEAVKRISFPYRGKHPQIPWNAIAEMRDNLIHNYDDIDLDEVWRTASIDIPVLRQHVEPLLPKQP